MTRKEAKEFFKSLKNQVPAEYFQCCMDILDCEVMKSVPGWDQISINLVGNLIGGRMSDK